MTVAIPPLLADMAPGLIGFLIAAGGWFLAKHARSGLDTKRRTDTPAE